MITKRIYYLYHWHVSAACPILWIFDYREDFGLLGPARDNYRLPTKKCLFLLGDFSLVEMPRNVLRC